MALWGLLCTKSLSNPEAQFISRNSVVFLKMFPKLGGLKPVVLWVLLNTGSQVLLDRVIPKPCHVKIGLLFTAKVASAAPFDGRGLFCAMMYFVLSSSDFVLFL